MRAYQGKTTAYMGFLVVLMVTIPPLQLFSLPLPLLIFEFQFDWTFLLKDSLSFNNLCWPFLLHLPCLLLLLLLLLLSYLQANLCIFAISTFASAPFTSNSLHLCLFYFSSLLFSPLSLSFAPPLALPLVFPLAPLLAFQWAFPFSFLPLRQLSSNLRGFLRWGAFCRILHGCRCYED